MGGKGLACRLDSYPGDGALKPDLGYLTDCPTFQPGRRNNNILRPDSSHGLPANHPAEVGQLTRLPVKTPLMDLPVYEIGAAEKTGNIGIGRLIEKFGGSAGLSQADRQAVGISGR